MNLKREKTWLWVGLSAGVLYALLKLVSALPFVGCLMCPINCVAWLLVPLTTGFLTIFLSNIKRNQLQEALIKSALAGLVLGIIGETAGIVSQLFSALLNLSYQTSWDMLQDSNYQFENALIMPTTGIAGSIALGAICCLGGIFIDVILSAIGGIIATAFKKD